jgi:putative ABC transport system permease protein
MLPGSIKIAFKVLARRKFYTFISLFAICFTLVILNVATAMIDATFGPMPPESNLDRTMGIFGAELSGERSRMNGLAGYGLLDKYARDLPNVELMSISTMVGPAYAYPDGKRVQMYLKRTDAEFWRILDFDFLEGGPFTAEDVASGNFVAVVNDATRRRLFGDAPAVGRSFDVDGQTFRIVGVVANVSNMRIVPFSDVWVPTTTAKSDAYRKELVGNSMGLLLARDSSDFPAIRDELDSRLNAVDLSSMKQFTHLTATSGTLAEWVAGSIFNDGHGRGNVAALFGAIGVAMVLFMLLPTINLTNVNVSRIMERATEIGVRKAFGASSWTLVGQFLVENVAITVAGSLVAFALTQVVLSAVDASGLIPYADLHVNLRVFFYGVAIAAFFGIVSGVYPAWRMSRLDPVTALKGGAR